MTRLVLEAKNLARYYPVSQVWVSQKNTSKP